MKYLLVVYCTCVFLSCSNKSETPFTPPSPKTSFLPQKEAANPYTPVDVSPMDMAYFPKDYAVDKMNNDSITLPVMRVIYSRPHRGGRKLFGELVKWGQPWRLGANEATEIQFFQPVTIQQQRIEKGQYVMYAIPYENRWTLVLNSNLYSWGLKLHPEKDLARFDVPTTNRADPIEYFTMLFQKTASGADLIIAWETKELRLPIQF